MSTAVLLLLLLYGEMLFQRVDMTFETQLSLCKLRIEWSYKMLCFIQERSFQTFLPLSIVFRDSLVGVIYEKQEVSVLLTFSADMRKAQALNSVKSESQSF